MMKIGFLAPAVLRFLVVASVSFAPCFAIAGDGDHGGISGGGGGNGLVCFEDRLQTLNIDFVATNLSSTPEKITFVSVLDLVQAQGDGVALDLPAMNESAQCYVERMIKSMKDLSPSLGEKLADAWSHLVIEGVQDSTPPNVLAGFQQIRDFGTLKAPIAEILQTRSLNSTRCGILTLAEQIKQEDGTVHVWLNHDVVDLIVHSDQSSGVLILHELVYSWARSLGQKTSADTRAVVGAWLAHQSLDQSKMETIFSARGFKF